MQRGASVAAATAAKYKSQTDIETLKQFLQYQKTRINDNIELHRASNNAAGGTGYIPLKKTGKGGGGGPALNRADQSPGDSRGFLKMARTEQ